MAKVKLTKTALKQERDALKQYTRFLPTLQLKTQQLQMEMRTCLDLIAENEKKEQEAKRSLDAWVRIFGDPETVKRVEENLSVRKILTGRRNIAGVDVPSYSGVEFEVGNYDLFLEEPWLDDAIAAIRRIVESRAERDIIREQYRLIGNELRVTTQRVNLFEKVKIPETKENIRIIQIYMGDMDTTAVGRSKIAKRKLQEVAA